MAILSKGTDFSTGDQVTADKLDALVDNATFASDAVDDSTTALDTNGKIIVKDGGITAAKLNVTNLQTATSNTGVVVLKAIDGANVELYGGSHASNASLMVLDANEVRIRSQDGSTSKMHIDSSGNVGIGTTSPSATLHVVDQGNAQPCILVQGASQTEGDIAVIDGESLQIGHWSGSSFTQRATICPGS